MAAYSGHLPLPPWMHLDVDPLWLRIHVRVEHAASGAVATDVLEDYTRLSADRLHKARTRGYAMWYEMDQAYKIALALTGGDR